MNASCITGCRRCRSWSNDKELNNPINIAASCRSTIREAARQIAQAAAPELDAELANITGGAVTGMNQISRLLKWLQAQGL